MIQVREYLRSKGKASVMEIAQQLQLSPDVVQDILARWAARGDVRLCESGMACSGGCSKCPKAHHFLFGTQEYEWVA